MIMGFGLFACALAFCLSSSLSSSSTKVVLSRTMADAKVRQSDEGDENIIDNQKRKSQERSLIIGALSSVHRSHSNRTRRHEYEDDEDDDEEEEGEDRYEDQFVFVGANYRFADKRGDDDDDDGEYTERREAERGADNEKTGRTGGGKRLEIDVEIGRSRGKSKRNGLLRPDRLRRQENPKNVAISTTDIPGDTRPTEEAAATVDSLSPLSFLDAMQTSLPPDCLSSTSTSSRTITLAHDLPPSLHSTFAEHASSLVQIANVLNNLFASSDPADLLSPNHYGIFYYSLVRAVVESNDALSAAAIAFDRSGEEDEDDGGDQGPKGQRRSGPFAYRNRTNGRVHVRDLANVVQG